MKKTVEEYLACGFSRPYAAYFASGRKKITAVTDNNDYTLTFDDGEKHRLDMSADLKEGVFKKIAAMKDFKRVYLNEEHTVCWDIVPRGTAVWNGTIRLTFDRTRAMWNPCRLERKIENRRARSP